MNRHHRKAAWLSGVTVLFNLGLGVGYGGTEHVGAWHGMYCSIGTTSTVGCDVTPTGWPGHALVLAMMMCIPLTGWVFSLITTGLLADHIKKHPPAPGGGQ